MASCSRESKTKVVKLMTFRCVALRQFYSFYDFWRVLIDAGFRVSTGWLSNLIKLWGYSFKKVEYRQLNKFTPENMAYYTSFIALMQQIPFSRLKFLDESHFKSKGSEKKFTTLIRFTYQFILEIDLNLRTGLSPIGVPLVANARAGLDLSYSLALMTTLDLDAPNPVVIGLCQESNNQWDFGAFILNCIACGHLKEGKCTQKINNRDQ
jgi:hypothetical protein